VAGGEAGAVRMGVEHHLPIAAVGRRWNGAVFIRAPGTASSARRWRRASPCARAATPTVGRRVGDQGDAGSALPLGRGVGHADRAPRAIRSPACARRTDLARADNGEHPYAPSPASTVRAGIGRIAGAPQCHCRDRRTSSRAVTWICGQGRCNASPNYHQ
jgi:hypothetical protein